MRKPLTALGIAALLMFAPALTQATDFVWDGSRSAAWSYVGPPPTFLNNWDWPGYPDDYGDRATVASKTGSYWPVLDGNYTVGQLSFANGTSGSPVQITTSDGTARTLTLDSTTYSGKVIVTDSDSLCYIEQLGIGGIYPVAMDIIAVGGTATYKLSAGTGGTLDMDGTLLIQAADSTDRDATLWISTGTFSPGTLDFRGSATESNGHAVGNFDVSVSGTSSTTVRGYADIDVLSPQALSVGSLTVGNSTDPAYLSITSDTASETPCVSATSMTVRAADTADKDSTCKLSTGTLDTSSSLSVQASHSAAADAMLWVASGTCTPATLEFQGSGSSSYGYAIGQFDADTTVDTSTTADGFAVIDVDTGKTFQPKATTIGSTAHAADVRIGYVSSPGTGTFQPTTLTIKGGDGSGEYAILRHTAGTLDTSGKLMIEEGTYGTDHTDYAELIASSSSDQAYTPSSMEMKGDARLDLDANMTVSGEFRITEAYSAAPTVDLAANVTVSVGSFVIDGGTNGVLVQPTFASGSKIQTN